MNRSVIFIDSGNMCEGSIDLVVILSIKSNKSRFARFCCIAGKCRLLRCGSGCWSMLLFFFQSIHQYFLCFGLKQSTISKIIIIINTYLIDHNSSQVETILDRKSILKNSSLLRRFRNARSAFHTCWDFWNLFDLVFYDSSLHRLPFV